MLRLILAAVLVSVCLAYPQRRDGAPAEAANLQGFAPGMMQAPQGLQPMQPMQEMSASLPFSANIPGMGYKRAADENLEERRGHSNFQEDKSPFGSDSDPEAFMKLFEDNGNTNPFADKDDASPDLGSFESDENGQEENKFRFFHQQP
nr:TPA_inf: conotoxin precursor B2 [Conus judaeus]